MTEREGAGAPIRVTYVINSLARGGAERFLCEVAPRLDPERFRAEVVCLYGAGPFSARLRAAGVPMRVAGLPRAVRPRGWIRMFQALGETPADVVHTHLPEAAWFGLPAAYLRRVPVRVSHLQNTFWQWPAKLRRLDRAAASFASVSIACSAAVRDFSRDQLHYRPDKLMVLPNAIDTSRFEDSSAQRDETRRSLGIETDAPVLLCVASLTEQKGHWYLLHALERVRSELPATRLLLVGSGNEEDGLRRIARELGQGEAVRFLGERDDVGRLMGASDVFALPSLWEGFGLVFVEAAAAGLPVVATAVDGVPEVVEAGVSGLLVPPRDPARLAEALLELLRDPARARSMGRAGTERARAKFDAADATRRLEALYAELTATA